MKNKQLSKALESSYYRKGTGRDSIIGGRETNRMNLHLSSFSSENTSQFAQNIPHKETENILD